MGMWRLAEFAALVPEFERMLELAVAKRRRRGRLTSTRGAGDSVRSAGEYGEHHSRERGWL